MRVIYFDLVVSEFLGDQLYRIGKSSQRLMVSIPMVRNWIYSGKIKTLRTIGGEHRIPEALGFSNELVKLISQENLIEMKFISSFLFNELIDLQE
ncbi:hypothetical protein LCGC14_1290270 [marine sediment metagenome]|uniref:Uncharacterized protein n=1 Tax=marine sediment metagenome TaxID=412755 RepID=A0A0F9NVM6_9ZZZZ